MNFRRIYFVAILLMAFGVGANGQELPKAVLVDEFANLFCSEGVRARLDNFFQTIIEKPGSVGYVVGKADASIPGRFQKYFLGFQNHVGFRQFPKELIQFYRGPDSTVMHFQFWIVPKGAAPPEVSLATRVEQIGASVMFDASEIGLLKKGHVEFGGGDEPCDWGLNLNHFAITLGANPSLEAYLIGSSNGGRDSVRTKNALRFTADELVKKHGVSSNRLKTVYVGNRGERTMQLWLVPKGSTPPTFREKSVP